MRKYSGHHHYGIWLGKVRKSGGWLRQHLLRDQSVTLLRLEGEALRQRLDAGADMGRG